MAEKEVGDYGAGIGNGNSQIKPGHFFGEESSWEALKEGCGVVVVKKDGENIAFSETWNNRHPHWRDYLAKRFVVAKMMYGQAAFLVEKRNGLLVWQSEEQKPKAERGRASSAVVPLWKQKKRFHFSQTNGDAVA